MTTHVVSIPNALAAIALGVIVIVYTQYSSDGEALAEDPLRSNVTLSQIQNELEQETSSVMRAEDLWEYWDACEELYRGRTDTQVLALKFHSDIGIALSAAWVEFLSSSQPVQRNNSKGFDFDVASIERFLGFVEGRLGVPLPKAWNQRIVRGRFGWGPPGLSRIQPPREVSILRKWFIGFRDGESQERAVSPVGLFAEEEISINEEMTELITNRVHIVLPPDVVSQLRDSDSDDIQKILGLEKIGKYLSVLVSEEHSYVALFSGECRYFCLTCIENDGGSVKWTAPIWAGEPPTMGDPHSNGHAVYIAEREGLVIVFGVSRPNAYIEGVNASDGTPAFRFYTSP